MAEVEFKSLGDSDTDKSVKKKATMPKKSSKKDSSVFSEFCSTFLDSTMDEVVHTVTQERIIPDIKALAYNAIVDGLGMFLGGGGGRRSRSSLDEGRRDYAKRGIDRNKSSINSDNRSSNGRRSGGFDSRDYQLETREDAERALWNLRKDCKEDGSASVARFLQLTGNVEDWSDWDIGWRELDETNSRTRIAGGKWVIVLPAPIRIRN